MTPEIHRMLMLSTAHFPAANILDGTLPRPLVCYDKAEYGWIIPLFADVHAEVEPAWLTPIADYARALDCTWLMFDRDADSIQGLPQW